VPSDVLCECVPWCVLRECEAWDDEWDDE